MNNSIGRTISLLVKFFLLFFFSITFIWADNYHNINTLIGERASGLGGAFTAISDDPSGTFYNPAGIAFAYEDYVSISANTYKQTYKSYEDVFGPGQSYTRKSNTFAPNFFGSIKSIGKFKAAFSVVSQNTESYDQSNEIYSPLSLPDISKFRIDYTEENSSYLVGPSLAYALTKNFAIGATLYYTNDTTKISSTQFVEGKNNSFSHVSIKDRRRSVGFVPTLGIQYMPFEQWSLGLSVKRYFITGRDRSITNTSTSSSSISSKYTTISNVSNLYGAQLQNNLIFWKPYENGGLPEINEVRVGSAHFLSKSFLFSYDVIHTSGYKFKQDRSQYELTKPYIFLTDNEDPSMYRKATTNYAVGLEYYLLETLALRLGYFTNYANTDKMDWKKAAIQKYLADTQKNLIQLTKEDALSFYSPMSLNPSPRFEHINNHGYTMSLSWDTAKSSITLTYVLEKGRGGSQINSTQLPQSMKYYSSALYLVASTHH